MKSEIPVIQGKGLRVVRDGSTLLDVPDFGIMEGEVLSLIGSNGAGKTTMLQTLSYLMKPFDGEVFFRGKKVGSGCPILTYRRALAMVFQEPLLFDTSVFENVASGLRLRGVEKSIVKGVVGEYLELFGIPQLRDRFARNLSGGEAQRTSLARAFATRPEVLLLDEPFRISRPRQSGTAHRRRAAYPAKNEDCRHSRDARPYGGPSTLRSDRRHGPGKDTSGRFRRRSDEQTSRRSSGLPRGGRNGHFRTGRDAYGGHFHGRGR